MATLDETNIFETPVTAQEPKRFSPEYFAQRKEQRAQQKIRKLQRELELEGGDMLPKTKKQTQQKIAKLIQEVNEMSK